MLVCERAVLCLVALAASTSHLLYTRFLQYLVALLLYLLVACEQVRLRVLMMMRTYVCVDWQTLTAFSQMCTARMTGV